MRPRTRDTLCGKTGAEGEKGVRFPTQYEETDWEFLRRGRYIRGGNGLLPESVFPETGSISACRTASARWATIRPLRYKGAILPEVSWRDGMILTGPGMC